MAMGITKNGMKGGGQAPGQCRWARAKTSARAAFQLVRSGSGTDNPDRGPLLLTMAGKDHTVPEAITKSTLKQYRHSPAKTNLVEFEDRGHSLTIDSGWPEVAEAPLAWLDEQGL